MYIDNTTKKHPVEPHCGGVSRAWLVEQLPKAKHPNMLLEVALHPYFPCTFCDFAYVTEDVLVDVFMGEDTLTAREACGLLRGLSNFKYITFDYMIEEQLTICEDKKRIEKAKEIARGFSGRHPAHSLIQQQLEQPLVPLAAVHGAERFRRQAEEDKRRKENVPQVRRAKLRLEEEVEA